MIDNEPASTAVESIAPWLSVVDVAGAVEYYKTAFGAVERSRFEDRSGRVVVAQLVVGDASSGSRRAPTSTPTPAGGGSA